MQEETDFAGGNAIIKPNRTHGRIYLPSVNRLIGGILFIYKIYTSFHTLLSQKQYTKNSINKGDWTKE